MTANEEPVILRVSSDGRIIVVILATAIAGASITKTKIGRHGHLITFLSYHYLNFILKYHSNNLKTAIITMLASLDP